MNRLTINYTDKMGLALPTDGDTNWGEAIRKNFTDIETKFDAVDQAVTAADNTALETRVGTVETDVNTLETTVGTLGTTVSTLETDVGTLETKVATLESNPVDDTTIHGKTVTAPTTTDTGKVLAYDDATQSYVWVDAPAGDGSGGTGGSLTELTATYTATGGETNIPLGVEYVDGDILEIHEEGVKLYKDLHYTLGADGVSIDLVGYTATAGHTFLVTVLKGGGGGTADTSELETRVEVTATKVASIESEVFNNVGFKMIESMLYTPSTFTSQTNEHGTEFTVSSSITFDTVHMKAFELGLYRLRMWQVSTVATVLDMEVEYQTEGAVQPFQLSNPITIQANENYVITYQKADKSTFLPYRTADDFVEDPANWVIDSSVTMVGGRYGDGTSFPANTNTAFYFGWFNLTGTLLESKVNKEIQSIPVDVTDIQDGYVLTYDSVLGKFVGKPKPTGGGGMTISVGVVIVDTPLNLQMADSGIAQIV